MRKLIISFVFLASILVILNCNYVEIEYNNLNNDINNSLIGLTIDGNSTTSFPGKEDGLAIGSIECDKGANGVWDYKNWLLKVRNVTENRTKCQVNFVRKYTESILNGADPVLKDGMIPVLISDEGVVKKASEGWEWYKYQNKHQWANAVILNDETKEYYDGDIISESEIESYFVWIPRYKYKIWNIGNYKTISSSIDTNQVHQIEIEFENKNVLASTGSTVGSWLTHPAFTVFDTDDNKVSGMWVGKFETGYKDAGNAEAAQQNSNDFPKIWIKPNVYSWRNIQPANAYLASRGYKEEYNSHMMKNTECGAVAYLQHSEYGSAASVRINNNSAYLTGYGAKSEPTTGYGVYSDYGTTISGASSSITEPWNTDSGRAASTTNNMYGVYDMSGGAWEYVMGVMVDKDTGKPCSGRNSQYNSGFNGKYCGTGETGALITGVDFPDDERYYDKYAYGPTDEVYNRRILGDATGEMGPFQTKTYGTSQRNIGSWHDDEAWFVGPNNPWFFSGHSFGNGSGAGVFAFGQYNGSAHPSGSFRVVLSV